MLTLLRLVAIRQARRSARLLPVFGVCVLLAAALVAVPPLFENAMGDRSLQRILREEPASTFELRVQQIRLPFQQGRAEVLDSAIGEAAARLGHLGGDRFRITTTSNGNLRPTGPTGATSSLMLGVFQSVPTFARDARVVAGMLPPSAVPASEPFPIAIGRAAAEETGLGLGDSLSFALNEPGGGTTDLEIVGVLEALDPAAGAWQGTNFWFELAQAGAGPLPPRLGLFVGGDEALSELAKRFPALRLNHHVAIGLRPEALTSDEVDEARAGLLAFDREMQRQPATRAATPFSSVLRDFATASGFHSSQVLLVTVQVAAVAVFALVLVGSHLAKRSRRDRSKLRTRGASRWQVVAPHALLSLAICVPAAALAAPFAAEVLEAASRLGLLGLADSSPLVTRLTLEAWLLGAGGALLGSACAILPALLEERRTFGEAGVRGAQRPTGSTMHRYGFDLVLLLVAAVLFAASSTTSARGLPRRCRVAAIPYCCSVPACSCWGRPLFWHGFSRRLSPAWRAWLGEAGHPG
ncbi:MAG TPA: hypothetical protein QGF05_14910 [Dehalococcoidia bacterium]|nr:hypothetical protein [Dehalococcoidia bacterium]